MQRWPRYGHLHWHRNVKVTLFFHMLGTYRSLDFVTTQRDFVVVHNVVLHFTGIFEKIFNNKYMCVFISFITGTQSSGKLIWNWQNESKKKSSRDVSANMCCFPKSKVGVIDGCHTEVTPRKCEGLDYFNCKPLLQIYLPKHRSTWKKYDSSICEC